MKRVLRHRANKLFLAPDLTWTDEVSKAMAFASTEDLLHFYEAHNVGDADVYYLAEPGRVSDLDFSFPISQKDIEALYQSYRKSRP